MEAVLIDNGGIGLMDALGGEGSAEDGGGKGGIFSGTACIAVVSVTDDREGMDFKGPEPVELAHVLPENVLESDCRGRALFV